MAIFACDGFVPEEMGLRISLIVEIMAQVATHMVPVAIGFMGVKAREENGGLARLVGDLPVRAYYGVHLNWVDYYY